MKRILVVCTVLLALVVARVGRGIEVDPIVPNAEWQEKIDRVASAIATPGRTGSERLREMEKLRPEFEKAPKEFGEQLLYYMTRTRDLSRGMAAGSLFGSLHSDKSRMLRLVLPYMECEEPGWRETVGLVLRGIEDSFGNRIPDFGYYTIVLREHAHNPPAALVRHMFRRDVSEALNSFVIVYPAPPPNTSTARDDRLRWADHIIHDAIRKRGFLDTFSRTPGGPPDAVVKLEALSRAEAQRELERLSQSQEWWVRLYAAEIMRQHGPLHAPDVFRKLSKDENALVRQATGEVPPRSIPPLPPLKSDPSK